MIRHERTWLRDAGGLFTRLQQEIPWEHRTVRVFGRDVLQPRLTAYFASVVYSYSGLALAPAKMPAYLADVVASVAEVAGVAFNSVLLNRYRDGSDSVAWHSDDEPELGENPIVASLSLGGSRDFAIRPKGGKADRITLGNGDLAIMPAGFQRTHQHAIPKTKLSVSERISLTFRRVTS